MTFGHGVSIHQRMWLFLFGFSLRRPPTLLMLVSQKSIYLQVLERVPVIHFVVHTPTRFRSHPEQLILQEEEFETGSDFQGEDIQNQGPEYPEPDPPSKPQEDEEYIVTNSRNGAKYWDDV